MEKIDEQTVPYKTHILVTAELANVKEVATMLVRKIQSQWHTSSYVSEELNNIINILKLPESVTLDNGVVGYYSRDTAFSKINGSIIWDAGNNVWTSQQMIEV